MKLSSKLWAIRLSRHLRLQFWIQAFLSWGRGAGTPNLFFKKRSVRLGKAEPFNDFLKEIKSWKESSRSLPRGR